MNHYDLAIYGHLTVDRIINNFKESVSLGAMANVWSALAKIDSKIKIKLEPCAIGEAIVLINEMSSQRFGRGNLNLKTTEPNIINSKWHHIMYLNRLKDKSFIYDLKGIISADIPQDALRYCKESHSYGISWSHCFTCGFCHCIRTLHI